jgi:hypothetical protein
MATIDKRHNGKWRAQVRRHGMGSVSRNFVSKKAAEKWARETEAALEAGTYAHKPKEKAQASQPKLSTLGQLIERYRDEVSSRKKGYAMEFTVLNAFLTHPLAAKDIPNNNCY